MIRVEVKEAPDGQFEWLVRGSFSCSGKSREPLLDACREIKRMGGEPAHQVALFRSRPTPDLVTIVGYGAGKTVVERSAENIRLENYRQLPKDVLRG